MNEALVTPSVLRWARERLGLSPEEAAKKVKVRPHKLLAWENDQAKPSFTQAMDLARVLCVPIGYLYLEKPPSQEIPIPDLRTLSGQPPRRLSVNFAELLNDVLRKQDWYRDYLLEENSDSLNLVGKFTLRASVQEVASDIRRELRIGEKTAEEAGSWAAYFSILVKRAEEKGVLVFRSGIVKENTHRPL